jgi:hypothetical protein
MALGDPLVLKDSALVDHNFDVTSSTVKPDGTVESIRVDRASAAATPVNLRVSQRITGKGLARVRRTLVGYTKVKINATSSVQSQLGINLTWVYPLNGDVTATDLYDGLCHLADLVLSTGSLAVDTTKVGYLLQGQT